jgi:hypothetical protein
MDSPTRIVMFCLQRRRPVARPPPLRIDVDQAAPAAGIELQLMPLPKFA